MLVHRPLDEVERLLLTTPDDTEEAPWMVMPEFQWNIVVLLRSILGRHARERHLRWHLASELKVVMPRFVAPRTLDLVPDLLMVEADDAERTSWNVEQEGQPPPLVLEVVTAESWERDTDQKPVLYDRMGVREYVIFAPLRTDGPALFGYRRDAAGRFIPWSADAAGRLHSRVLVGLRLYQEGTRLRVEDAQGQRLPSDEEVAALERARAEQEKTRADQATAQAAQEAARAEREAMRAEREAMRAADETARAEREEARAAQETARADREEARGEQEAARAEQEATRASQAMARAEGEALARLAAEEEVRRLRALLDQRGS